MFENSLFDKYLQLWNINNTIFTDNIFTNSNYFI